MQATFFPVAALVAMIPNCLDLPDDDVPSEPTTIQLDRLVTLSAEGAVCNNGESANYQVTIEAPDGTEASTKWVLFFEGGGSCRDDASCNDRTTYQTSPANSYPEAGRPPLTRGPNEAFEGFNTVQVHYCSSDGWTGSRLGSTEVKDEDEPFTVGGTEGYAIHFRGKQILKAVLDSLEADHGLRDATEVVVAGTSAGSVVPQNQIDKIAARFGDTTRLRGLLMDGVVPTRPSR